MNKLIIALSVFATAACGGTSIPDVQGPGAASPMSGQTVTISAIVTGDFQDNDSDTGNNLGGFYVQQQTPDADAATSEGIFIFDGDSIADLERYEGMLVRFPQKLTVSNLYFLQRYGEVGLSQGGRLYQFTNGNAPDIAAYAAHKEDVASRSIVLDDGMRSTNPATSRYLNAGTAADYSIRTVDGTEERRLDQSAGPQCRRLFFSV
jgi:predicted extracellular nuclease